MSVTFVEGKSKSNPLGGWKVNAYNGRRVRQKFFSRKAPKNVPQEKWDRVQELRAEHLDALCKKNSAAAKYLRFVRQNHALVKPARGIGIHGFNLSIMPKNKDDDQYYCGFVVLSGEGDQKRFLIRAPHRTYTDVLHEAIDFWAESHDVRPKDKARVLANAPGPECFKALRRQLNQEGMSIPVSVLSDAYYEQRQDFVLQRIEKRENTRIDMPDTIDIAHWFEEQRNAETA